MFTIQDCRQRRSKGAVAFFLQGTLQLRITIFGVWLSACMLLLWAAGVLPRGNVLCCRLDWLRGKWTETQVYTETQIISYQGRCPKAAWLSGWENSGLSRFSTPKSTINPIHRGVTFNFAHRDVALHMPIFFFLIYRTIKKQDMPINFSLIAPSLSEHGTWMYGRKTESSDGTHSWDDLVYNLACSWPCTMPLGLAATGLWPVHTVTSPRAAGPGSTVHGHERPYASRLHDKPCPTMGEGRTAVGFGPCGQAYRPASQCSIEIKDIIVLILWTPNCRKWLGGTFYNKSLLGDILNVESVLVRSDLMGSHLASLGTVAVMKNDGFLSLGLTLYFHWATISFPQWALACISANNGGDNSEQNPKDQVATWKAGEKTKLPCPHCKHPRAPIALIWSKEILPTLGLIHGDI